MKKVIFLFCSVWVLFSSSCGVHLDSKKQETDNRIWGTSIDKEAVMLMSEYVIRVSSGNHVATFQLYDTESAEELPPLLPGRECGMTGWPLLW